MKLGDFLNAVAAKADTEGTKINAAAVRRVVAVTFDELAKQSAADAADTISKGLAAAAKRAGKK